MAKRTLLFVVTLIGMSVAQERPAHAALFLQLSDGVSTTALIGPTAEPGPVTFSGAVGRYTVTLTAGTGNSPGLPAFGRLEITNLSVSLNTDNSVATRDLTINLAATDYTDPSGSPLVLDSSGSVTFTNVTPGVASWSFQSFADGTNSGTFQAGVGTPGVSITAPAPTTGSLAANDTSVEFTRGPMYSLSSVTTIRLVTLGSSVLTTGASVTTAVPEPGTLVMAFASLPLLSGLYLRRRVLRVNQSR